jgi:hypothetical protein
MCNEWVRKRLAFCPSDRHFVNLGSPPKVRPHVLGHSLRIPSQITGRAANIDAAREEAFSGHLEMMFQILFRGCHPPFRSRRQPPWAQVSRKSMDHPPSFLSVSRRLDASHAARSFELLQRQVRQEMMEEQARRELIPAHDSWDLDIETMNEFATRVPVAMRAHSLSGLIGAKASMPLGKSTPLGLIKKPGRSMSDPANFLVSSNSRVVSAFASFSLSGSDILIPGFSYCNWGCTRTRSVGPKSVTVCGHARTNAHTHTHTYTHAHTQKIQ